MPALFILKMKPNYTLPQLNTPQIKRPPENTSSGQELRGEVTEVFFEVLFEIKGLPDIIKGETFRTHTAARH